MYIFKDKNMNSNKSTVFLVGQFQVEIITMVSLFRWKINEIRRCDWLLLRKSNKICDTTSSIST